MDRKTTRALCVGWLCAGAALIFTEVYRLPLSTSLVVIFIAGAAPTLWALNRQP